MKGRILQAMAVLGMLTVLAVGAKLTTIREVRGFSRLDFTEQGFLKEEVFERYKEVGIFKIGDTVIDEVKDIGQTSNHELVVIKKDGTVYIIPLTLQK